MNLHSYPKVYAIGHRAVQDLFSDTVVVQEKVDGSQFSFGLINGEIEMRSHGAEVRFGDNNKMFNAAKETVCKAIADKLHPEWIYRAEFLSKPKHNVLCYKRVPVGSLIVFDINVGLENYLAPTVVHQEAELLGLEVVPTMFVGKVNSPEMVRDFLKSESCLGGPVEGVVVKNYNRFGIDGKVLMGKFVTEQFKETHNKEWKAANPTIGDIVDQLVATLRNERRWEKAIERLRDAGKLEHSPRDIGPLIKTIQEDLATEERDFIETKLVEWAMPRIMRASSAGVAEWYKDRLLKSAFPTEPTNAE